MINKKIILPLLVGMVLAGCNSETGTPYEKPSPDTLVPISFGAHYPIDDEGGSLVPNYTTFGDDSANLSINFGSKTFTYGETDVTLKGFGFLE